MHTHLRNVNICNTGDIAPNILPVFDNVNEAPTVSIDMTVGATNLGTVGGTFTAPADFPLLTTSLTITPVVAGLVNDTAVFAIIDWGDGTHGQAGIGTPEPHDITSFTRTAGEYEGLMLVYFQSGFITGRAFRWTWDGEQITTVTYDSPAVTAYQYTLSRVFQKYDNTCTPVGGPFDVAGVPYTVLGVLSSQDIEQVRIESFPWSNIRPFDNITPPIRTTVGSTSGLLSLAGVVGTTTNPVWLAADLIREVEIVVLTPGARLLVRYDKNNGDQVTRQIVEGVWQFTSELNESQITGVLITNQVPVLTQLIVNRLSKRP